MINEVLGRLPQKEQVEGVRHFAQKDGWTCIAWWDRSGDERHGSIAAFALQAVLTANEAEAHARKLFPAVFARIDVHLLKVAPASDLLLKWRVANVLTKADIETWRKAAALLGGE